MTPRPLVLIILDGWGCRNAKDANAITTAHTPVWDKLLKECPNTTLSASGLDVGLPPNQMGNSEVGHLTMGAGRVVFQDLTRVTTAIENGEFNQNPVFITALEKACQQNHALHILGLLSPGGVHSHEEHLYALVRLAAAKGVSTVYIHAILDGRDTPPQSAKASLLTLQKICDSLASTTTARIASITGRYYAMDRDKRFERTELFYDLLTTNLAPYTFGSAIDALEAAYARGETDEFVKPTRIAPAVHLQEDDVVIMMNFRSDRVRQICEALRNPGFSAFPRKVFLKFADFVTLTEYASDLDAHVAFPPLPLENMFGEYVEQHHLKQLRIAETEKYAHVTFFFNGGRERPFQNEDRILIPSPKIATYDLAPEMSAKQLTQQLIQSIQSTQYDVIICNYANADMVGHTGNFPAAVRAIETLDTCLGQVLTALKTVGGEAVITADHGNAELMFDARTHQPHTAHTLERVPFIYVGRTGTITHQTGTLADIAPTLISLLNLPLAPQMTGQSLIHLQ